MVHTSHPPSDTPITKITSLTASRDAETVRRIITNTYDFTPTLQYCEDLIKFIEDMTDGQQQQPRRIG